MLSTTQKEPFGDSLCDTLSNIYIVFIKTKKLPESMDTRVSVQRMSNHFLSRSYCLAQVKLTISFMYTSNFNKCYYICRIISFHIQTSPNAIQQRAAEMGIVSKCQEEELNVCVMLAGQGNAVKLTQMTVHQTYVKMEEPAQTLSMVSIVRAKHHGQDLHVGQVKYSIERNKHANQLVRNTKFV